MAKRTGNNKMINQMDFQKKKNSKELSEKDKNNLSMKMFADYVQKLGNNNLSNEQKELERNHYQKRTIGNDKNFIKAYEGYPSADQNASPQEVEQYFSNDVPNFFQKYGESLKKENSETAKENLSDYESNYNKFKVQTDKVRGYINRNKNGMTQEQYDDAIEYLRSVRSASMAMRHNFRVYDQYYSSMTKEQASAIDKGYILDDSDLNVTDERVKIRQEQWHKNNARMLELNRQIASIQNQEAKLNTFFDNPGASYNSELNELIAERDRISTEQKRYENGQKKYDDAFKIRSLDDFEKLSEPKDNIPTKADYDAYEADLKAKNNLDAKRKELAKDPTNGLPDKLGTFLRDSEKNLNQAHINRINTNGITSLYEDVLLEGDKKNWSKLTDREIEMYYYKLNEEGQESAYKWLDDLQTELDRRKTNEDYEKAENASALDKILMNVASVPANIIGAPLSFASDVSNIVRDNEINPYDNLHSLQNYAQAVRGVTAKEIDEAFGNKKLKGIDFGFGDAYQSVMSGFDSLVGAGLLGPVYTPFMAMGASSSASKDLYEQGYSKEQVALGGFLAGAAEWFFENKSIENYLNAPDAKTKKGILKNVLQQAGVEASEEIFTELANIVSDVAVKGSMSDWKKWEQDGGISNAIKESVLQATSAGLGGALSGGLMSGVGSSMQYHNYGTMMSDYGSRKVYDADMLLDMAKEGSLPVNMDTTKVQKALDNLQNGEFKNKNFREVGDFVSETEIRLKEQATKRAIKSYIEADRLENGDTSPVTTEEVNRIYDENYRKSDEQITDYETPYVDKAIKNRNLKPSDVSTETQINSASETEPVINSYNDNTEIISNHNEVERNYADIKRNYADIKRDYIDTYRQPDKHIEDSINPYTEETARSREVRSSDIPTEYSPKSYNDYKNANESKYVSTEESMYYTPTRVISSDNGRLTMVNERGEKSVTGNTDYSSQKQAVTYETIASMQTSTNSANQIADMVKNTPDRYISRTMLGIKEAYTYGRIGQRFETIKPNFISDIPVEMAKEAYNLGRTDSMIRPEMQNVNAVQKYDGVKYVGNVNRKSLTKNQRRQIDLVGQIAKNVTGSNVVVYESVLNSNGERVLDVNLPGRMAGQTAPNGIFSSSDGTIYIDANAGNAGSGLIMHTAAHELTHFASQYSDKFDSLREFVVNEFVDNGKDFDSLVMRKMNQNQSLNYYEATEEVIADAMSGMFTNTDSLEKIARLKEHDQTLFEKLKEVFNNLYNKIKDFYTKYSPESIEGQMMLDMKDSLDQVAQLFSETLVDAGEKFQALQEVGLQYDTETESIAPDTMMSERTWSESEYVQEVEKTAKKIAKELKVDLETAKKYIEDINSVAKAIADDRVRLDYDQNLDPNATVIKPNSEYTWTVDMSTLCAKRLLFTGTFDAIQKALPNTVLDSEDTVRLRKMMMDKGYQVACGICYVESTRREIGAITNEFIERYKKSQKDGKPISRINSKGQEVVLTEKGTQETFVADPNYTPKLSHLNTTDIDKVKVAHPEVYRAYLTFMNARGQAKPKLLETRAEYKGEILKHFKNKTSVNARNKVGGLRLQSFSDFEIPHMIDMMQITMDMSRVGLKSQAYTKVPEFAEVFGDTGIKINLSLIAKGDGIDSDGNLIFDDVEGIDHKKAFDLRNQYSKNVGTILVGKNDAHIIAAMADPRIDFIIPFHKSSWKESLYEALGLTGYSDYTATQNEKPIDTSRKIKNFDPSEYWNPNKTGDENAQIYLEKCREDGRIPKFPQFQSYPGYWKLLIDFKMYDNDGVYSPQEVVKPVFHDDINQRILDEYEGGHRSFPVASDVVDEFVNSYKEEHPGADLENNPDELLIDDAYLIDDDYLETDEELIDKIIKAEPGLMEIISEMLNSEIGSVVDDVKEEINNKKPSTKRRIDEVNKRLKSLGVTFDGTGVASWTDESVEKYLKDFASSSPNYAQAYITYMSPMDYLKLTMGANTNTVDRIETETNEYGDLDIDKISSDSPIRLYVSKARTKINVEGHEGRHRMLLFAKAGFNKIPVLMFDSSNKYSKEPHEKMVLKPQNFGGDGLISRTREVTVNDVVPFSRAYKEEIISKFGTGNSSADVRFSERDTSNRTLSSSQQSYFSDSVVRDTDGRLKVVYHGSPSTNINEFDPDQTGTHTGAYRDNAFWFTDDKKFADDFSYEFNDSGSNLSYTRGQKGKVYEGYLNMTNPFDLTNPSQEVLDYLYEVDDKEHVDKLLKVGNHKLLKSYIDMDEIRDMGFDGIIAKTSVRGDTLEYGVFESNQFKYADNVEPTSSGDIRYSDRVLMGSYFSGGGTLESGLVYKMLEKEFAVEYDGKIAEVWEDNHGKDKMFVGDVRDFNKNVDDLFYFHASPSCQSSSKSNHKRGETETDITTAQATADRIRSSKPPVVSIENVKEYKDTKSYKIITDTLDELGYTWDANIYKASDYGNPTKRERLLIRAVESGLELPDVPGKVSEKTSWGDATRDLWGDLEQYHLNASTVKAIRNTPGLKNLDLLKQDKALLVYGTNNGGRVDYAWEDELCPTLTTKCGDARIIIDGKVYKPTVEFMGRLQGLPDDFNYTKKTLSFKIIGNGIPVQLTQAVMGGLLDSTYSQTHEGKVLYSERDTETNKQQERTTKFLQKQNEKLKKDNEYLKQLVRLQGKVTDGKVMSRSSIQKVAKQIMTNAGVKGNSEEFYGIIEDLYTYIREGGDEELEAKANSAVDWLVDHHKTVQNRTDDANAVLGHLIGKRIRVTPEQKAEIESQYGSYNDFRKQLFGSVTITTKDDAPTLESMWGEMAELFPYAFDDDTNVLDMPITLLTVVDQMKNSYESDMEEYDFSADMTRQELLTDVYDGYWKVSSLHTVADKYQKQINELKAKHDEEVRKIRQDYTEKLRELKSDYKEQNKNAREYYRQKSEEKIADVRKKQQEATDRKKTTEVRNKVKKIAEDLKSSTWRTKGVTYPEGLVQSVIKICEMIDPTGVDQTTKAAQEYWSARDALRNLRDEYDKMSDYGYDFSSEYDIYLSYYINQLASAVGNKPLRDMDRDQINQVYEILNDIKHCITTATKIYGHEDMKNTFIAGESVMDNMEFIKAKGLTTKAPGKILREWTLNPIRATREMTGYNEDSVLYKLMSDINEGRIKQDMFVMECNKMLEGFRESTKDRKTYNDAVEKEFDFGLTDVKGRPAMISKMQAMQALMTYERAESNEGQKHLEAPVLFLDVKLASKGKLDEAYNNGKVVRVNKDFVNKVTEKLTDWDRAYMATAKKIFNEKAKNAINETTLITKHRIVATDKNYIPYVVNKNELSRDSENLSFNASIENEGMLKRLTLNADTQLIISGLNTILDDHVKRVGKVYGLTVPIRNWNKVFNMKEQRERDQERRTVKKSISNTWGESAVKLLDKAVADMQGSAPRDISKLVTHVKNAFVTSTLASNISVTMKQFASYPTAGAVLSSGSLFKAFGSFMVSGKAQQRLWDEIDAHTPQHYTRRLGMSIQELGEMNQTNGVLNKVNHKMGMMSPMNWIQAFDVRTTQALWNAAKYDAGKKFEKGSEEYWDLATKLYNRTLEDTQPMYDSLHRAQVTKNQQLSTFVMFQTQPLQNSGILHEGYMRRKAMIKMHGRKSVQVKEANKQFRDAVMSQLASHLLFTGMTLLSAFLLHRMNPWRDKNKEVTWESVSEEFGKEFLKNYANAILPFANYIFSAFERVFLDGTYDVLSDPVVDKINGTFTTIDKLKKYPSISTTADFVADILSYFGVPASNVLKIKRGVQMHLTDIKNGTFLEAGVYRTPKEMSDRIYRFKIEGDEEALDAEKKKFSSEPSFYNSLREGLTNNDPRIKKAAKARKAGKMSEYKELAKSIIDEGVFTQNDVVKAINKIINADKEKEEQKESSTIVGFYTKDDVRDAIHDGDLDFITEYQDDYIQTAKDNGKDEDKAKTYAKNNIKAVADEEFESGDIKKEIYAKILSEYCGTDEEEANSIAEYAVYLNNHPDTTIEKKTYAVYNTKYKDQPFTLEEYNDYWENTHDIKGKDLDGDGRSDPYTAMDQYIEYIDSMNISEEKKTALFKIKYPSDKSMERVTW